MSSQLPSDSSLQEQIDAYRAERASKGLGNPNAAAAYARLIDQLVQNQAAQHSLQAGMPAPDFSLPNVDGRTITLPELLQSGPVVVTFYRGDWCPFCNFTLRSYENILPQIQAAGASLVAISPQTPNYSILTAQNKGLTYPVLSDVGNVTARRYGLVFTLPEYVRPYAANFAEYNGDSNWELPMPGTFIIDRDRTTAFASVNPNYMQRLEPATILTELHKLQPAPASSSMNRES